MSARIAALGSMADFSGRRIELMQVVVTLPSQLRALSAQREAQDLLRAIRTSGSATA